MKLIQIFFVNKTIFMLYLRDKLFLYNEQGEIN